VSPGNLRRLRALGLPGANDATIRLLSSLVRVLATHFDLCSFHSAMKNSGRIEEGLTKRTKGLDQDNEQSHGRTDCLGGLAPDYRVLS
jgi:hypothetical protein